MASAASAASAKPPAPADDIEDDADWGDDGGEDGWGDDGDAGDWGDESAVDTAMPAAVSPILTRQASYVVLDNASLSEQQESLIRQTAEVLFVTPNEAGCLLRHYGWKSRQLQQEWFEAQSKVRATVGLTSEEDARKPPLTEEGLVQCCSAYCDEVPPSQAHALNCGHVFCNDCWTNYLTSQIQHGAACVFATCMGMRCGESHVHKLGCQCNEMVPEALFDRFVTDRALLEKYKRWLLDSFVEGQRHIKWCPKPGCTLAVTYQSGGTRSVQCKCGYSFCFTCLQEAHSPAPCDLVKTWLDREQSDDATAIWLAARTKECPKCSVRIEKNKACNHMTCIKCGHHFCWLCKEPWDKHGSASGGYYNCNVYDASVKEGKLSKEEQSAITSAKVLQKYTYYYKRYKSSQDAIGLTRKIGDKLERALKHQEISKFSFIFDALGKLIAARQVLQWSYALAYYFKSGGEKSLFEYQQGLLTQATEELQDIVDHQCDSIDKLQQMRKDILNKSASIDKFRTEMVAQVERGEFEHLLLAEADAEQDRWACIACKSENDRKRTHCSNPACGACKLHGEPDCKASTCKVQQIVPVR